MGSIILTPGPRTFRMRAPVEVAQVGIGAQLADLVQTQIHDAVDIAFLGIVAVCRHIARPFGQLWRDLPQLFEVERGAALGEGR